MTVTNTDTEDFYRLDEHELSFLKGATGITDDDALKKHIFEMRDVALKVYPYPCIKRLGFIRLKMPKNPEAYEHVLNLGKNDPNAILIELGCCLGNDVRNIAAAGFPSQNILASDLRSGFWDVSNQLYCNPTGDFKGSFIPGDALDPEFLDLLPQLTEAPPPPPPVLSTLTSFNPLHGYVSAIHTGSFFHLFSEEHQLFIARKFAGLLSPKAGSMIFGCHGSQPTKGFMRASGSNQIFCHTPESWEEMWTTQVFKPGQVEVKAWLKNSGKVLNNETDFWMLYWSVKRL
ncbi:hypothetical protein FB45DRAFT_977155 [Roridomyces roridus]|uniref:Methyltransferase ausD n=1 Tax=Roridomyces roridus TaxID=1738132 RepID=A0AAD7C5B4_9AGAR|nr:hypothetical protein FB45DRAFT_977155 [Roridomyces roridus]